eukprot:GHVU01215821.1.p1 GENE.GHVU01215821.1~~GHVU01215821.1.p1  ORF type:complete len:176 (+),score=20.40 GHVU01215821.1:205-732(+)
MASRVEPSSRDPSSRDAAMQEKTPEINETRMNTQLSGYYPLLGDIEMQTGTVSSPPQPLFSFQADETQTGVERGGEQGSVVALESLPADTIRQMCAKEGVAGRRDGKRKRSKSELVELLKAHRVSRQQVENANTVLDGESVAIEATEVTGSPTAPSTTIAPSRVTIRVGGGSDPV